MFDAFSKTNLPLPLPSPRKAQVPSVEDSVGGANGSLVEVDRGPYHGICRVGDGLWHLIDEWNHASDAQAHVPGDQRGDESENGSDAGIDYESRSPLKMQRVQFSRLTDSLDQTGIRLRNGHPYHHSSVVRV